MKTKERKHLSKENMPTRGVRGGFEEFFGFVGDEAYKGFAYEGYGGKISGLLLVGCIEWRNPREFARLGIWFYQNESDAFTIWHDGIMHFKDNVSIESSEYAQLVAMFRAIYDGGDPEPLVDWVMENHSRWMGMIEDKA